MSDKGGKKMKVPDGENFEVAQNPEQVHALVVFCDYGFEPAKSTQCAGTQHNPFKAE